MKTFNFKGTDVSVKVIRTITPNRIQLTSVTDGVPLAMATANLPSLDNIEGYVAVKNYNENEGMLKFLLENDIVEWPVTFIEENQVSFPICKLK